MPLDLTFYVELTIVCHRTWLFILDLQLHAIGPDLLSCNYNFMLLDLAFYTGAVELNSGPHAPFLHAYFRIVLLVSKVLGWISLPCLILSLFHTIM